jgi:Domain of unknown function (DUF4129)
VIGHVRSPGRSELRACALAAVAEAGVLALPASLLLIEGAGVGAANAAIALPIAVAVVAGATLVCRLRAAVNVAPAAGVIAVAAGLALGAGNPGRSAFAILVLLLVEVRVIAIGLRDWRMPIEAAIAWGAVALGVETILGVVAVPEWRPSLVAVIPVFFVASLMSRATTVWEASDAATEAVPAAEAAWVRRSILAAGALGGAMALALVLSVRGGLFDLLGRVIRPIALVAISILVFVVAQAARPILWMIERLGVDPDAARELFERLRADAEEGARRAGETPSGSSGWGRFLGLLVLVGLGLLAFRMLRRRSVPEPDVERPSIPRGGTVSDPVALEPLPPVRSRFRRELPADAVRRSYAQVLIALREKHIPKEPSITPTEFAAEVADAIPRGAEDFRALTRAYEDVRYGSRRLGRADVHRIDASRRRLLGLLEQDFRGRSS